MATTKITTGVSFLRAIEYDLKNGHNKEDREKISMLPATKDEAVAEGFKEGQRARLLATNVPGESHSEIASHFDHAAKQKPNKKEPVHKVSINLKPGEHLEIHQWLEVAHSYLNEMGYGDSPFLIAQHREKDHEHVHIVTSKVDFNGKVVSDSFERKRARQWAAKVEEKYNLSATPNRAPEKGLTRVEVEQSLKNSSTPLKLILQETVKQTLKTNNEAPDFIDALHRQSISVKIKTNPEKEIFGISFGINGRNFKGSSLGANFTWQGLQENGLNYEHERDYAKLEEASRRASQSRSEQTESLIERSSQSEISDNDIAGGITDIDRFSGEQSHRGTEVRSSSRNERGGDSAEAQSIPCSAGTDEHFSEEANRAIESRNQSQLRRTWRSDTGEVETSGRIESESSQTIAAEENSPLTGQQHLDHTKENEYDQLHQQSLEFLNRSTDIQASSSAENVRATETQDLREAGIRNSAVSEINNGMGGCNITDPANDILADWSILQRSFQIGEGNLHIYSNISGSIYGVSNSDFSNGSNGVSILGDSIRSERDNESSQTNAVNLSAKLRESLDDAKTIVEETISIQDALEAEKAEQAKLEEEMDVEVQRGPVMSL